MAETSGSIDFTYNGETLKTWYKVVGDLRSARPLVTLHGGPGHPHNYMLPHAEPAAARGILVVFYDQVGIGHSTHLRDKPAALWTVELFIAELENVLAHLGIASDFGLLGHSWGGMLAMEYAIRVHSLVLKYPVLTDSLASMELWEVSVHKLLKQLLIGRSEFNITGTLKTWSVVDKLHTIKYPTLVKWVQFVESSHVPFFGEKERYFNILGDLLKL